MKKYFLNLVKDEISYNFPYLHFFVAFQTILPSLFKTNWYFCISDCCQTMQYEKLHLLQFEWLWEALPRLCARLFEPLGMSLRFHCQHFQYLRFEDENHEVPYQLHLDWFSFGRFAGDASIHPLYDSQILTQFTPSLFTLQLRMGCFL